MPVAVVTDAAHETGRDVARRLAGRGWAVVAVYLDDQDGVERTVDDAFAAGGTAVAVRADLTDDLDVERLFDETIAAFGGIDALVDITPVDSSLLFDHAVGHLRRGARIVSVRKMPAALAERLRERGITSDHGVEDVLAFLDR